MKRPFFLPDTFTLLLLGTVALASVWPARGAWAQVLDPISSSVVALLFFLHGSKLSRQAIWAGIGHWRLHLAVVGTSFVFFPLLGWLLKPVFAWVLPAPLVQGVLFLCALPATVQSAVVLTGIARGNMAAAVCSASASTLLGIVLTPLWASVLLSVDASGAKLDPLSSAGRIALHLLLPFVVGHLLRPITQGLMQKAGSKIRIVDQGSILLVVYATFSSSVTSGLWDAVPLSALLALLAVCVLLLGTAFVWCSQLARRMGMSAGDEITIMLCAAQKSMVSGVPMAKVLFAAGIVGPMVLPVMLFHSLQLTIASFIARHYGQRQGD